jgi:hypothetical protein
MISIASTLIHPGRGSPRVSLANNEVEEWREDDFGFRLELGGGLLEQEDNTGATEGKRESGARVERFEEGRTGVVSMS